jgi:hypothetical protein
MPDKMPVHTTNASLSRRTLWSGNAPKFPPSQDVPSTDYVEAFLAHFFFTCYLKP